MDGDLYINGPEKEIQMFKEFAKGKNDDGTDNAIVTSNFIPYPKKFEQQDTDAREYHKKHGWGKDSPKDGFNSGGYNWCVKEWGSKWGISNAELVDDTKESLQYSFDSAWSPVRPVVTKMGELFPELEFRYTYFECGCQFNGQLIVEKGKVTSDEQARYFGDRGG